NPSCASSGTHTEVGSPARCSRASISLSRRSVLTRSPAFLEDERWRHYLAVPIQFDQLSMQAVPARPCLVAERRFSVAFPELANQRHDRLGSIGNLAHIPHRHVVRPPKPQLSLYEHPAQHTW